MRYIQRILRLVFHRFVLVAAALLLQLSAIVLIILRFSEYYLLFYVVCEILGIVSAFALVSGKSNPSYRMAWVTLILIVPIFGLLFYAMFGRPTLSRRRIRKMRNINERMESELRSGDIAERYANIEREIAEHNPEAAMQSHYLTDCAMCPPYSGTRTEYLTLGEAKHKRLIEELKKAKRYIFLEYFIVEEGRMWNSVLEILAEKTRCGVDVRLIYDDMGCILLLPPRYDRILKKLGLKCCVFNRFTPLLSSFQNNRDHRKICVIDGKTGFTGGINIADEYINAYEKLGHWKDTAVMLKGDAVWSLTVMFLSMWEYLSRSKEDYGAFRPIETEAYPDACGYVQPFADNPLDDEPVGETVYLNLIGKARRYVYITTPYLIIDSDIIKAFCIAAKNGADIRIITPHMGDSRIVHTVTRSYYACLIENGVRIFEYTPGFIHSKTFVVDGEYGVVGTVNLDYRSLFLHFECGVWMYGTDSVKDMRDDFARTLRKCREITLEECRNWNPFYKAVQSVLRLFSPLM